MRVASRLACGGRNPRGPCHAAPAPPQPDTLTAVAEYVYTMFRANKFFGPDKQVLKDISLSFLPGAKIGVLGLNGAGKSTLLKVMAGEDDSFTGEA